MKYPLPFFKRRTKKPTSPPGLSPSLQSPGRSKKRVGQLSVLSVWERVCVSAYGRPFSCRTALFLFSPPLSSVESVDLGVLSSPLARLLRLLPLVPSSSLSELRRGRDPARRLRRKKEVRRRLDERTEESDGATRLDGDGSRDPEHPRE